MKTHKITTILSLVFIFTLGCQNQAISESVPPPPPMEESEFFSQAELDQMLAPIALYPDALLSQVLMAATYPLEVIEASRWSKELNLDGENAVEAAQDQDWDISIKALVAFPDLIQLMDEQLSWTRRLGDAFLIQEEQVMQTIQELRRRSLDEGSLESLDHLVIKEESDVIIVEPRDVEVVYVPYYNTRYVYGDWWWYDYPPVYWDYPYYGYNHIGFHWSRGFRISTRFYFSFCDWHHHSIYLHRHYWNRDRHDIAHRDSHRYHDQDTKVWNHNPHHRRGVEYRTEDLNRTHDRKSASGVTQANLPTRTRPSGRAKPPLQETKIIRDTTDGLTQNNPQKKLPTSNRSARSTTNTETVAKTSPAAPTSTSKYSLPSSNSRSKSRGTSGQTTAPTRSQMGKAPILSSRSSRTPASSRTTAPASRSTPSSSKEYTLPSSSRNKSANTTARTPTTSRPSAGKAPVISSRSPTRSRPPVSAPPPPRQTSSGSSSQPTYSSGNSGRSSSSGSSSGSTYRGSSRSSSGGSSLGRSSRSSGRPPSSTASRDK